MTDHLNPEEIQQARELCGAQLDTSHGIIRCGLVRDHEDEQHRGRCWACAEEEPENEWVRWKTIPVQLPPSTPTPLS